jgi:hypothetical protein
MQIHVEECNDSPRLELGESSSHEKKLRVIITPATATVTTTQVMQALYQWIATHAPNVGKLHPSRFSITPIDGTACYDAMVAYGVRKRPSQYPMEYSASTTGGTAHITQSLETVRSVYCKNSVTIEPDPNDGVSRMASPSLAILSAGDGKVAVSVTTTASDAWIAYYVGSIVVEFSPTSDFASPQQITSTTHGTFIFQGVDTSGDFFVRAKHVTKSSQTNDSLWVYATPCNFGTPDFGGGIGMNDDGSFDGCDVKRPAFRFTETHYFPYEFYTMAYRNILIGLTACVNSEEFRGFPAGTVLFEGVENLSLVTDSDDGDGELKYYWKISYQFVVEPNVSGLRVGSSPPFSKNGWDYLWIWRKKLKLTDSEGEPSTVMSPYTANVERVYEYENFALLMINDMYGILP